MLSFDGTLKQDKPRQKSPIAFEQLTGKAVSRLAFARQPVLGSGDTVTLQNVMLSQKQTRLYTADAVLYRQPSGQPTNMVMLNLN